MNVVYKDRVEAIGKLILKGIWYSDAVEIVLTVLGPTKYIRSCTLEDDVNEYVDKAMADGVRVPQPQYKNIF
tara:strand:- start:8440 stop:8655 length:216 start_codon:yes stop_codon:yes gene_type:complete